MDRTNSDVDKVELAWKRYREQGDKEAVVKANIGLVIMVARKYYGKGQLAGHAPADIIQMGAMGLWKAVEKYDPAKGVWSSFAERWIRQGITHGLRYSHGLIRISTSAYQKHTVELPDFVSFSAILEDGDYCTALGVVDETHERIAEILGRLGEIDRLIIERKIIDGATYSDIAEEIGRGDGWVSKRCRSILAQLREQMESENET